MRSLIAVFVNGLAVCSAVAQQPPPLAPSDDAVNKNSIAQVNMGTGKDVSDESLSDAGEPLQVRWHTDSYVNIPFDR